MKLVLSSSFTPVAALWSLFRITFREPTFSLLAPVFMISTVSMLASDACNSPPLIAIISDAVSYSFLNASSRYWLTLTALIDLTYWFSMRYVSFCSFELNASTGRLLSSLGLLCSHLRFYPTLDRRSLVLWAFLTSGLWWWRLIGLGRQVLNGYKSLL